MRPRLVIDDKLYFSDMLAYPGYPIYRVKVSNKSRHFHVYDVSIAARAYIYGLDANAPNDYTIFILSIGGKSTPYISSKRGTQEHFTSNERFFVIRPPYYNVVDKGQLRRHYNRLHPDKQLGQIMSLEDVFDVVTATKEQAVIEVSVTATSVFSSSRAFFTRQFKWDNRSELPTGDKQSAELDEQGVE